MRLLTKVNFDYYGGSPHMYEWNIQDGEMTKEELEYYVHELKETIKNAYSNGISEFIEIGDLIINVSKTSAIRLQILED